MSREIDKEMAEEAMGWKAIPWKGCGEDEIWGSSTGKRWWIGEFKPTERIQDAWLVVEKIDKSFILKRLATGQYWAQFEDSKRGVDKDTASMAICLAAREAIRNGR